MNISNIISVALALVLYWTNPGLNVNGTTCNDLSEVRFIVTQKATGNTYVTDYPLWAVVENDSIYWRSHEAFPDSARFALPHSSTPYDWWWIKAVTVDFAGNVRDTSNTISVNANDY